MKEATNVDKICMWVISNDTAPIKLISIHFPIYVQFVEAVPSACYIERRLFNSFRSLLKEVINKMSSRRQNKVTFVQFGVRTRVYTVGGTHHSAQRRHAFAKGFLETTSVCDLMPEPIDLPGELTPLMESYLLDVQ